MLKQIITTTALIAASVAMANAADVNLTTGRTNILGSGDSTTNNTVETTFVITAGQLFARNNSSTAARELLSSIVIDGEGYQNSSEPKVALRLHANNGPVNLSGNLTIGGTGSVTSTSIWSSGAVSNQNTISGNILLANGATITTVNLVNSSALLNLTGTTIQLPTLNLATGTSVKFNSAGISFTSITGTGTVAFETGSKIALAAGESLTIAANAGALSFGGTTIDTNVTKEFLSSYFSGASIESVSYAGNVLTVVGAIPEPSLFGVLAGLGALALVGTRRRRK